MAGQSWADQMEDEEIFADLSDEDVPNMPKETPKASPPSSAISRGEAPAPAISRGSIKGGDGWETVVPKSSRRASKPPPKQSSTPKPSASQIVRNEARERELSDINLRLCQTIEGMDARSIGLALQILVRQGIVEAKDPYRLMREVEGFAVQYAIMECFHLHMMSPLELEVMLCSIFKYFEKRIYSGAEMVKMGCLTSMPRPRGWRFRTMAEFVKAREKTERDFVTIGSSLPTAPVLRDVYHNTIGFAATTVAKTATM